MNENIATGILCTAIVVIPAYVIIKIWLSTKGGRHR